MRKATDLATFEVADDPESAPRLIGCAGRIRQTLEALIEAGERGTTSLEMSSWALRLGHFVFVLRRQHGLMISTEREGHDIGEISGFHARYRLLSKVRALDAAEIRERVTARLRLDDVRGAA